MIEKKLKESIWINGLFGKMGAALDELIKVSDHFDLIGGACKDSFETKVSQIKNSSLIIDFSSANGSKRLAEYVVKNHIESKSFVICSTGLDKDTISLYHEIAKSNKVLMAPNTSIGIIASLKACDVISDLLLGESFDIEIEETHHKDKQDVPSGTALFLAKHLAKKNSLTINTHRLAARKQGELGIQSTRGGGVFGEHSIRFIGEQEEISIHHKAFSRKLFARGCLILAKWLVRKQVAGFYKLADIIPD